MTFPTDIIETSGFDNSGQNPSLARESLRQAVVALNAITDGAGQAGGAVVLNAEGNIPRYLIGEDLITTEGGTMTGNLLLDYHIPANADNSNTAVNLRWLIERIDAALSVLNSTYLAFSEFSDGHDFTLNPINGSTIYIGVKHQLYTLPPPTVATDYDWSRLKGEIGKTGPEGPQGVAGIDFTRSTSGGGSNGRA